MNSKWGVRFVVLALVGLSFFHKGSVGLAQTPPDANTVDAFIVALQMHDTNTAWQVLESHTNLARPLGYGPKLPLLEAAADGDLRVVKRLVELGIDVNGAGDVWLSGNAQMTALEAAARNGQADICEWLLKMGADPNHRSFSGETALHFALGNWRPITNQQQIVRMLLDYGASPFVEAGYYKTTPLELEIARSDGTLVPLMLDANQATEFRSKFAPGSEMRRNEARAKVQFLAANGAALLSAAVQHGEPEAVQALLKAGVPATNSPNGNYSLLQNLALAEARAEKAKDFAPERWAKIRELLQNNGSPYDVFAATGFGDLNAASNFWAMNKSVVREQDCRGENLLHWSVRTDRLPLTEFWIQAGVSPAVTNSAGQTPLHLAAQLDLASQAAPLLAANAPLDLKDTNGLKPFDVAVEAKNPGIVRLLLAKSPTGVSRFGFSTPLHKAARNGDTNLLVETLPTATNLDARDELGFTPFQVAVLHGHLLVATRLLEAGADVNARDAKGNTALHLLMLEPPGYIADLPPMRWYAQIRQDPQTTNFLDYLLLGGTSSQQSALFTTATFLLANKADAAATNDAGQYAEQLLMAPSVFVYDNERSTLMRLLGTSAGPAADRGINARDANGDTALFRAARDVDAGKVDELIAAGAFVNATNYLGRTPLHAAVEKIYAWPGPLLELLKAGANVNAQDNDGMTPLHLLGISDNSFRVEATQALLEAGANPNSQDKQGRTPLNLFLAGKWPWQNASECIALLLQAGANPSATDSRGRTPLFYLAALGHQQPLFFIKNATNYFSLAKVNIQARDDAADTPLHVAARSGTTDVFNWLVQQGADLDLTNNAGETPRLLALHSTNVFAQPEFAALTDIFQAARDGNLETVSNLLKTLPQLLNGTNFFGETPLRLAAANHHTNVVEFLAQQGAQWDAVSAILVGRDDVLRDLIARQPHPATNSFGGQTLLHLAAANGQIAAVKLLLAAGADLKMPNVWGLSPLGVALAHHQTPIANLLLNQSASENIFDAVSLGDEKAVKALLAENKSLALATNKTGLPVTAVATALGHAGILKWLLDDGALLTSGGNTLLHVAAIYNQTNAAALLLRHGAKVEVFNRMGYTPLQMAASEDSTGVAALLLKHGWFKHEANPNTRTIAPPIDTQQPRFTPPPMQVGNTALHLAALYAQTNMIALLLKSGADVNATNSMGMTPLDFIASTGPPFAIRLPGTFPRRGFRLNFEPGILPQPLNPFAILVGRRRAAADLLERAGGKHGARFSQNVWGPHLIPR